MAAKEDLIFTAAPSSDFQIEQNNDDISSENKNLFFAIADKINGVCGKIIKPEEFYYIMVLVGPLLDPGPI